MATPYRRTLPVLQEAPTPEPTKVSCSDCVWFETLHGGHLRGCHLFSTSPYQPGDPKYVGNLEAKQKFDFNRNGDCFGFRAPWHMRLLRWMNTLIRA